MYLCIHVYVIGGRRCQKVAFEGTVSGGLHFVHCLWSVFIEIQYFSCSYENIVCTALLSQMSKFQLKYIMSGKLLKLYKDLNLFIIALEYVDIARFSWRSILQLENSQLCKPNGIPDVLQGMWQGGHFSCVSYLTQFTQLEEVNMRRCVCIQNLLI